MDLEIKKPLPLNEEVVWDTTKTIMSKTDIYGTIEYVNEVFAEVSGYQEYELVGQPHNIVRHPDMPQIIFKVLWDNIKKGHKFHGIIKNLSKSGRYYWVITDFDYVVDDNANITKYIARRKAVPSQVIKKVDDLYTKLLQIEQVRGIDGSEKFLTGYLEELGMTYVQLITKLMIDETNEAEEKQELEVAKTNDDLEHVRSGFFSKFFATKLNLF
ncbi:PAS domain-containing protein [Flavobacterium columnare]|uniref:PAS domain-containing protein n=1 Tax=Flavobacterium columnare TaxID=996 RepID=UPI000D1BD84A|nr:PAS domain-containing protein [Flavobacterium columnare]MBF6654317.1 histidine kinase [Flavobacterium columnare]MBF6656735.1 histidine kinase [Flavobacterium columnare]PTD13613.1 histidine kinase [Flavobacterium columnare]QOG90224.1 PAS domain-containing protein [Flavobacterium columnare]QOG92880.1 PAS domain-containing protein [Flavobacterium columnare]